MRANRFRRRAAIALVLCLLAPPSLYVLWDTQVAHNFGTIQSGRIYRSSQMPAGALARTVRDYGVKTVLNLRGANLAQPWYRAERAATAAAGATQVDMALSSCEWMSRAQLRALVRVLDTSDYPLLLHCQWGSERTGWVSAVATLLRPGATLADAQQQFSLGYLFVRVGNGKVMAEHLDQYERWLKRQGWDHTPARFRLWVDSGFTPGHPSREDWPYDPYPLVVITRPDSAQTSASGADADGSHPALRR
jgi:protein tyrosine phosphatase (PTP) superfamily phosphohydrolase (DUF442 family)